tara:strand:- start:100 stop:261 length:162 start_codon:yes stop_codon:yes gene_type:complete
MNERLLRAVAFAKKMNAMPNPNLAPINKQGNEQMKISKSVNSKRRSKGMKING